MIVPLGHPRLQIIQGLPPSFLDQVPPRLPHADSGFRLVQLQPQRRQPLPSRLILGQGHHLPAQQPGQDRPLGVTGGPGK